MEETLKCDQLTLGKLEFDSLVLPVVQKWLMAPMDALKPSDTLKAGIVLEFPHEGNGHPREIDL